MSFVLVDIYPTGASWMRAGLSAEPLSAAPDQGIIQSTVVHVIFHHAIRFGDLLLPTSNDQADAARRR
jgi:hypothetical protein